MTYSRERYATSFNAVAAQYAATRPGYPPQLFDAVEELADRSLSGATVLDVGAGTGIATRLLRDRGARVVAVEPGAGMAAQLRAGAPDLPLVRASGDALPFAAGAVDFVTYAQAWHWTDPARSVPEAMRVLRPGGALALWWNVADPDCAWTREQGERFVRRVANHRRQRTADVSGDLIEELGLGLRHHSRHDLRWSRRISLDDHLAMIGSQSFLAVLDPAESAAVLAEERAELLRIFPDGMLTEPYAVSLTVVLRD
jgi:SAM-dependent methyltransferase